MPSLRKRVWPSGKTTWDIRYRMDGKQSVHSLGAVDSKTAGKLYHRFSADFAEGRIHDGRFGIKLTGVVDWALQQAELWNNPKTAERKRYALIAWIKTIGNIAISDLCEENIERHKAIRLQIVSVATVNLELRVLQGALRKAAESGVLKSVTSPKFRFIKSGKRELPSYLTDAQVRRLLENQDPDFRRFLCFLLNTGCRRNEALELTWVQVDLDNRQLSILGKGGKSRLIPMNEELHKMLSAMTAKKTGRVFPDYSASQVSVRFQRWAQEINLPAGATLHTLRATFACHLRDKGVDIYTISQLLGHSSVKMTEKYYLAPNPNEAKKAVELLKFEPVGEVRIEVEVVRRGNGQTMEVQGIN